MNLDSALATALAPALATARVTGLASNNIVLLLVGLAVVIPLLCLGVILLSRQIAARREEDLHRDLQEQRQDIERREHRLAEREARLDAETEQLEERRREVDAAEEERRALLERTAMLTVEEARQELLGAAEHEARLQGSILARDIERSMREEAETKARRTLATVVQRLAAEQTTESTVSVVPLPSDDMKGRIIGREGRNIRAFEQITGVNVVIDETPEAVVLSCFDPVRREVARVTLESLVADGRIHPTRIEEVHQRAEGQVEEMCRRAGEDACLEMGITDLHPELVQTMGRLTFRTSYGQNVLKHLVESGHAAGLLADELGLDRALCVRAAFLHDIGKALTHEVEGSHAMVGADLARRFGESEDVVHAIEAHHNEVEPRTVEAVLTQAADAISGSRPGARRESIAAYLERLHRLEEIALSRPGVDKVFAMQAGRDVRVMVLPDQVDDLGAQMLARDIAKQFEEELSYPGQIKVTVIRESRSTEVAR
jgi:ribonuclease Y